MKNLVNNIESPFLFVKGNISIRMANHNGVIMYTKERIVVSTKPYAIEFEGKDLEIKQYSKEEMEIVGEIQLIRYCV